MSSSEESEGKLAKELYRNKNRDNKNQQQMINESENLLSKMMDNKNRNTKYTFQDTIKSEKQPRNSGQSNKNYKETDMISQMFKSLKDEI